MSLILLEGHHGIWMYGGGFISSRPKVGIITYGIGLHNCSQDVHDLTIPLWRETFSDRTQKGRYWIAWTNSFLLQNISYMLSNLPCDSLHFYMLTSPHTHVHTYVVIWRCISLHDVCTKLGLCVLKKYSKNKYLKSPWLCYLYGCCDGYEVFNKLL